jgi:hypothetical protein
LKTLASVLLLLLSLPALSQNTPAPPSDPLKSLIFLEGTWEAQAQGNTGATATGTYTFKRELGDHILARRSSSPSACKGPVTFDCEHADLLFVYQVASGQPLKAIYFDNEGHVIHYNISTPAPTTAIFLSDSSRPGPQFRLVYELKGTIMFGKFQMQIPGQTEWKSYLEWSGPKIKQ